MHSFIVKRSSWHRGTSRNSYLLNNKQYMCCLGFLAKSCKATDDEILGIFCPVNATSVNWPRGVIRKNSIYDVYEHSDVISEIIKINDVPEFSNQDRENQLTEKFKELDIHVTFED